MAGWREQEAQLKDKLRHARGDHAPSPEALEVIGRLDELLERLSEADREKLSFAIRQTVKRIILRRERRGDGKQRITLWDGVIELRDDLGVADVIPPTDDDIPSPGRWHDAVQCIRKQDGVVYLQDCADALGVNKAFASRLLAHKPFSAARSAIWANRKAGSPPNRRVLRCSLSSRLLDTVQYWKGGAK